MDKDKIQRDLEIKMKNVLSDIYESEAAAMDELERRKNKHQKRVDALQEELDQLKESRELLEKKYNSFKKASEKDLIKAREEIEMALIDIQGSKETFIRTAEKKIEWINDQIDDLEKSMKDAGKDASKELEKSIDNFKEKRDELQDQVEKARQDATESWLEMKKIFAEKYASFKESIKYTWKKYVGS